MSRFGSSAARRRIFAQISFALSSRTSDPSQTMRSLRSWSKTLLTSAGWAIGYAPFQLSRMSNLPLGTPPPGPRALSADRASECRVEGGTQVVDEVIGVLQSDRKPQVPVAPELLGIVGDSGPTPAHVHDERFVVSERDRGGDEP